MNTTSLDKIDRQLLQALKTNSRASLVSLARDIGLSRSATHDRIARLEERGIIKGYTIEVDHTALPNIRAFLTVTFAGVANHTTTDAIHALQGIKAAYCLSGDIDMLVYCETDTAEALRDLRDQIAQFDGIITIITRQVLASSGP